MKRIQRLTLSNSTASFLTSRQRTVAKAKDPHSEAVRLWPQQSNQAFREIRKTLARMATGLIRCMYCEGSEGTDIEHFWPKSVYPERAFDWLNYLIACARCNSNFKRDQFPLDGAGAPLLVNRARKNRLIISPSLQGLAGSSLGLPREIPRSRFSTLIGQL
jgi:5-methylcytosine-specific restriction endonuclease McrA